LLIIPNNVSGITQEEIEREGVKGYGAVLTIGWETVQAHMVGAVVRGLFVLWADGVLLQDFRTTQCFKDNIHLLRQTAQKIEMHHVKFLNYVK
jgi:hypothetical protein